MTPSARRSEEDPAYRSSDRDFIEANDLVERNVSGALNSNFAFYRGLSDGGAFEVEIPEELMLPRSGGRNRNCGATRSNGSIRSSFRPIPG
jgi:hypothetical protein